MCNAELLASLAEHVCAAFATVHPPLRQILVRPVEGNWIAVTCHQVHDDELSRRNVRNQPREWLLFAEVWKTYHILWNFMAVIAGAVEGLARETQANRCVNAGALLYFPEMSKIAML
jgi:hypothetical protein